MLRNLFYLASPSSLQSGNICKSLYSVLYFSYCSALEAVQEEWSGLKVCISNNFLDLNFKALWKRVLNSYSDRFFNILMLVAILLIVPLSTSCCEWGFSLMGKIKSDRWSCLSVDILDSLIRVNTEGPPVSDFDPLPTLKTWWNSGPRVRHPNFND